MYSITDLFIFCIAAEYAHTVDEIEEMWYPEVMFARKRGSKTILVCLNDHCRSDPSQLSKLPNFIYCKEHEMLDHNNAKKLAKHIGALDYIVCKGTSSDEDIQNMMMEVRSSSAPMLSKVLTVILL